jgi:hypothetical protein
VPYLHQVSYDTHFSLATPYNNALTVAAAVVTTSAVYIIKGTGTVPVLFYASAANMLLLLLHLMVLKNNETVFC